VALNPSGDLIGSGSSELGNPHGRPFVRSRTGAIGTAGQVLAEYASIEKRERNRRNVREKGP